MDDALIFIAIATGAFLLSRRQSDISPGVVNARDELLARKTSPSSVADFAQMDTIDTGTADATIADMNVYYNAPHELPLFVTTPNTSFDMLGSPTGGTFTNVSFIGDLMNWTESKIPGTYLNAIRTAEVRYGLPKNLLARLLYQESAYRPDIINGSTASPAGALGIAQFMPKTATALGIDPLNPFQSINAAGQLLKTLYKKFGTWENTLAAYNWGEGNVASWIKTGVGVKGQRMPLETQNYFTQILADVGTSGTVMV